MSNKTPYSQIIEDGKIFRTFHPDVENEELKWHQDLKNREVIILKSGGWQFQMENTLPNKLQDGDHIFIPKFAWHRVIKGENILEVQISEYD